MPEALYADAVCDVDLYFWHRCWFVADSVCVSGVNVHCSSSPSWSFKYLVSWPAGPDLSLLSLTWNILASWSRSVSPARKGIRSSSSARIQPTAQISTPEKVQKLQKSSTVIIREKNLPVCFTNFYLTKKTVVFVPLNLCLQKKISFEKYSKQRIERLFLFHFCKTSDQIAKDIPVSFSWDKGLGRNRLK